MSENLLDTRISAAYDKLRNVFGIEDDIVGLEAYKFLDLDTLIEAYKTDATKDLVSEAYINIAKTIRKFRSSYIPLNYFKEYNTFSIDVSSNVAMQESYENTFMRLLGMPSVGDYEFGISSEDIEIRKSESLKVLNYETGLLEETSFEDVKQKILTERQMVRDFRTVKIDDSIYSIKELVGDLPQEEGIITASIENLENDIWKFCYLLLPPIQDVNISKYINEPDKIVAKPFAPKVKVNGETPKISLLETIIRIRLDRVSGTTNFSTNALTSEADKVVYEAKIGGTESIPVDPDSYGILESLFILRLRSSIAGLAKKIYKDIDIAITEMISKQVVPKNSSISDGSPDLNTHSHLQQKELENAPAENEQITDVGSSFLEEQLVIEDSISFLLGNRGEAIDLQAQTQRTSGIFDSPIMSGIVDIVELPKRRILSDIKTLSASRLDSPAKVLDPTLKAIDTALGTDIGVGAIDVAVFSLALFTISESSLLGLLSKTQFDRLKNSEFKGLINEEEKKDTVLSINELTELVYWGYQLFLTDLKNDVNYF